MNTPVDNEIIVPDKMKITTLDGEVSETTVAKKVENNSVVKSVDTTILDNKKASSELHSNKTLNIEDSNNTNCLALTIKKEHKLVAFKNITIRSIRMTWKVAISTLVLNIIRLFS